jgi:hypothetical protein
MVSVQMAFGGAIGRLCNLREVGCGNQRRNVATDMPSPHLGVNPSEHAGNVPPAGFYAIWRSARSA